MCDLLRFSRRSLSDLAKYPELTTRCEKCRREKPARFHHCNVCMTCISCMDHHCPWINGCLGFYNMRYFLLFMTYIVLADLFMVFSRLLFAHTPYLAGTALATFTVSLNALLAFTMGVLGSWNWYVAATGQTVIEYWGKRSGRFGKQRLDFSFPTIRENLYAVFGTYSYWKMWMPSVRDWPLTGLEWTFAEGESNKKLTKSE